MIVIFSSSVCWNLTIFFKHHFFLFYGGNLLAGVQYPTCSNDVFNQFVGRKFSDYAAAIISFDSANFGCFNQNAWLYNSFIVCIWQLLLCLPIGMAYRKNCGCDRDSSNKLENCVITAGIHSSQAILVISEV